MFKTAVFTVLVFSALSVCQVAFPFPELKLPFEADEKHKVICTQGNWDDPSNVPGNKNPTHDKGKNSDKDIYAWDFDLVYGANILAPARARVIQTVKDEDKGGTYGKYLRIQFINGDRFFFAHCSEILVNVGNEVEQGQILAKVGGTGGWPVHLHFSGEDTSGKPKKATFVDVVGDDGNGYGVPVEDKKYFSTNTVYVPHDFIPQLTQEFTDLFQAYLTKPYPTRYYSGSAGSLVGEPDYS